VRMFSNGGTVRIRHCSLPLLTLLTCAEASTPRKLLDKLPLRFEESRNPGTPDRTGFVARGANYTLSLAPDRSMLDWTDHSKSSHVATRLVNANPDATGCPCSRIISAAPRRNGVPM
jgi:hypothetical protein